MVSRRGFLKLSAVSGAALLASRLRLQRILAAFPRPTLEPAEISKYQAPLIIPRAMPLQDYRSRYDDYEITVQQFQQQILPKGLPATTVWSYGVAYRPETFQYPALTIEAQAGRMVRVNWTNGLVDKRGYYLPHLLPVDPTLNWANPPGGVFGRDTRPTFESTPGPYTGPVPLVTHVHGAHTFQESDGHPQAWYLPDAKNIPDGYARTGRYYDLFRLGSLFGKFWKPGSAQFWYPNDQRASTLWYHDQTLGMSRLNLYAGPAGFYLLRGGPGDLPAGVLPGPAPALRDSDGTKYYEIPIVIQDRSFNEDGSLFYPDTREFFDGIAGPYNPESDLSPIWNPEFFGNTIVANGQTWPYLEVEQRRYRFRFLNGCNSRFLILKFDSNLPFWQIGAEGGFLPEPVRLNQLLLSPAERADVVVDFTDVQVNSELTLLNLGPDGPFGGVSEEGFQAADPNTTGQVMQFRVVAAPDTDPSIPPDQLELPEVATLSPERNKRQVSLNEIMSRTIDPNTGEPRFKALAAASLGLVANPEGEPRGVPKMWSDPVTETPDPGDTEIWEIYNFTQAAQPIHVHMVTFQVVDRQPVHGASRLPESWESGYKDTVIAYPGEITRIKARFDYAGLFVWHSHIAELEDNQMLRPYMVGVGGFHAHLPYIVK